MKSRNIFLVLDTETCDLQGNVYDVGFTVCDRSGKILHRYNALVNEIFTDAKKMMGAFYARKLFTHYAPMLDRGDISLQSWATVSDAIRSAVSEFNVNTICAYNLAFDLRVMRNTGKLLAGEPILDRKFKLLCIWRFACQAKLNSATYKSLARNQGWVTSAGNLKTGAEYAYRFCRGDWGFIEDHTALSDAEIETEILASCFATRKAIPYDDVSDKYARAPWRIVNSEEG